MSIDKGTQVRLAANSFQSGVVCRFIDGNPVVAWVGDNLITVHHPHELSIMTESDPCYYRLEKK